MTILRIHGADGLAPTRLLHTALYRLAPDLFTTGTDSPWERSALAVVPRCTQIHGGPLGCRCDRRAHSAAWYDLQRTRPLLTEYDPQVVHRPFGPVLGRLPMPGLRPLQERLAEQGEPSLQGWSPQQISLVGGTDRALERERAHRLQTAQHITAHSYDWASAARTYLPLLRAGLEQMVELTPAQRAEAAHAWVWEAEQEVSDAERSLRDRRRAAQVRPERLAQSEERLQQAHKDLVAAEWMRERTGGLPV